MTDECCVRMIYDDDAAVVVVVALVVGSLGKIQFTSVTNQKCPHSLRSVGTIPPGTRYGTVQRSSDF